MSKNEILLLQPIENLGNEGDTVTVRPGYARNYLLPRKLAIPVTRANRKQIEVLRVRSEERRKRELEAAQSRAERLKDIRIAIAVKTGPGGRVFGSVTSQNLIDRLKEEGIELERKQLSLHTPAKTLGSHTTKVRLHEEISVDFEYEIVSENPIEEIEEES